MATPNMINTLAGIDEHSAAAALRRQKPDLATFAQGSYDVLLEPAEPGSFTAIERHAVGYRVGLVTDFETVAEHHRARLLEVGAPDDLVRTLADISTTQKLSPRLAAIVTHTDKVTRDPATASETDIAALAQAGLSPTEIVTLGQLIGFLAYQVRAIAVTRAFGESV